MTSSLPLFLLLLLQISTSYASPSVPVATQAIVTTITAPVVSNILSTVQTVIQTTSTYENIQTITTVDSNGNPLTTTTDEGPTQTVIQVTSDFVATIPSTADVTFESTIGESTILGPDPTTDASTSNNAPATTPTVNTAVAVPTGSAVTDLSPAPAGLTQSSTYTSLGITYAPKTTSDSSDTTATSLANPTPTSSFSAEPTSTPSVAHSSQMSTGAKAAIGSATVVACIFSALILFWLNKLRRQRKAIREQYPNGQAPGDEAGIFGFFQPIVGKPYEKDDKQDNGIKMGEKPAGVASGPSMMVQELDKNDLTPPAVEVPQEPYRRPIPQRNPHSPHSPMSPISPVQDSHLPFSQQQRRSYGPESASQFPSEPFQKGFPRPLSRFPSHHATRSSGNVNAPADLFDKG